MAIFSAIARKRGHAVLVVIYDPQLFGFANRIVYIEDGLLTREEFADPAVAALSEPEKNAGVIPLDLRGDEVCGLRRAR